MFIPFLRFVVHVQNTVKREESLDGWRTKIDQWRWSVFFLYWPGVEPVHFRNAWLKALCSEKPNRSAISQIGKFFWRKYVEAISFLARSKIFWNVVFSAFSIFCSFRGLAAMSDAILSMVIFSPRATFLPIIPKTLFVHLFESYNWSKSFFAKCSSVWKRVGSAKKTGWSRVLFLMTISFFCRLNSKGAIKISLWSWILAGLSCWNLTSTSLKLSSAILRRIFT